MTDARIESFELEVASKALDPFGTHHEFVGGFHGQKLDYDRIDDDDPVFNMGVELAADKIAREEDSGELVIVGVANGATRIARAIASIIDIPKVTVLETEKTARGVRYTKNSLQYLARHVINSIKVVDDVGKSGESIAQVALQSWDNGTINNLSAFVLWQRRERMQQLDVLGIPYSAVVKHPLPDYTKQECEEIGFCKEGWQLIKKEQ